MQDTSCRTNQGRQVAHSLVKNITPSSIKATPFSFKPNDFMRANWYLTFTCSVNKIKPYIFSASNSKQATSLGLVKWGICFEMHVYMQMQYMISTLHSSRCFENIILQNEFNIVTVKKKVLPQKDCLFLLQLRGYRSKMLLFLWEFYSACKRKGN